MRDHVASLWLGLFLAVSVVAFAGLAPRPAAAAVMTFSGIGPGCGTSGVNYTEDGITATIAAANNNPGVLHLDDFHEFCPSTSTFTTGTLFDAFSVRILPMDDGRTNYCADQGADGNRCNDLIFDGGYDPYANVRWEGLLEGTVVATDEFYMGTSSWTYLFGDDFAGIDALRVTALTGPFLGGGTGCWQFPCAHFEVDDLTLALALAPVPVPPAALLLLTGLAGLGLLRRRA
jgi:hypothetical protein